MNRLKDWLIYKLICYWHVCIKNRFTKHNQLVSSVYLKSSSCGPLWAYYSGQIRGNNKAVWERCYCRVILYSGLWKESYQILKSISRDSQDWIFYRHAWMLASPMHSLKIYFRPHVSSVHLKSSSGGPL